MFHLERLGGASEAADDYGHTGAEVTMRAYIMLRCRGMLQCARPCWNIHASSGKVPRIRKAGRHFTGVRNDSYSLQRAHRVDGRLFNRGDVKLSLTKASGGFATVCRILLASPSFAEVATRTARGWTALHLAAAHGLEEVVHVLLKHPRFKVVTAQDCVGRNALHAAAEAGHRNVCKLLMAHENARVLATTKDYGGNRASDLASGAALEVPLH
eukprot:s477_g10.t2